MKKARSIIVSLALLGTLPLASCGKKNETNEQQSAITINKSAINLVVGGSEILEVNYTGSGALVWSSSNDGVAKVENGKVTAISQGTATISVVVEGKTLNCVVTVTLDINQVQYSTEYYFESLDGEFVKDASKTVSGVAELGKAIQADIKTFDGFSFDESNINNLTSITLSESAHVMSVYYSRNTYEVKVLGGSSKEIGKYGEVITIVPMEKNSVVSIESGEGATINGNDVTIGTGNVVVVCTANSKMHLESNVLLSDVSSSASVDMEVRESNKISGLVFAHSAKDLSHDGIERFYVLGTLNKKLVFCESEDTVLKVIKTSQNELSLGKHSLKFEINEESIVNCYVDGEQKMSVSPTEINEAGYKISGDYGRIGYYSQDKIFAFSNLITSSGSVSLEDAKAYYKNLGNKFKFSQHEFNINTSAVDEGVVDVDLKGVPSTSAAAYKMEDDIDSASSLDDVFECLLGSVERKIECQKEYTKYALMKMLDLVHNSFARIRFRTQDCMIEGAIPMDQDFNKGDPRWYVPLCYRLRVDGQVALLDEMELAIINSKTLDEIYAVSDRFAEDLVRALCCRDVDFYYWSEQNLDPSIVLPQWWYLWNYNSTSGSPTCTYYGNAFKDNPPTIGDFRLQRVFYRPEGVYQENEDGVFAVKGINTLIANMDWMLKWQTSPNRTYNITLNTNGGSVSTRSLTGNASFGASIKLPVPTREGFAFAGWYPSRLMLGDPLANNVIPDGNTRDVTYYAAWKKDGVRVENSVAPAPYITENMVIQQKKPIVISGSGKDGVEVTVKFDNEEKKATISNGKWLVTFDARDASYDEKVMEISGDGIEYTFKNILIGEVWVTTGQSNMDMLPTWGGLPYIGKVNDLKNLNKIRTFRQYQDTAPNSDTYNQDRWTYNENGWDAMDKSIISTIFACKLQEVLDVPVGVVNSSLGGTYIEEWLTEENVIATANTIPVEAGDIASRLYHLMTAQLENLKCSGVIWYQGENNWDHPQEYKAQYKKLVEQYRDIFDDENLPVIAQQLVQFGTAPYDFSEMRLAQWEVANEIENAYCSCAIDSGYQSDIHPQDKEIPSFRMADLALEYVYNKIEDAQCYYPVSVAVINGKIVVTFEDGKSLYAINNVITHMQLKLSDGSLVDVNATIVDNTIVINDVADAVAVAYAYGAWLGEITLFGGNDKPVAPFVINIDR